MQTGTLLGLPPGISSSVANQMTGNPTVALEPAGIVGNPATAWNGTLGTTIDFAPVDGPSVPLAGPPGGLDFDGGFGMLSPSSLAAAIQANAFTAYLAWTLDTAPNTDNPNPYNNAAVLVDQSNYWGTYVRTNAGQNYLQAYQYQFTNRVVQVPIPLATPLAFCWFFDGTTLTLTRSNGDSASIGAESVGSLSGPLRLARNGLGTNCKIHRVYVYNAVDPPATRATRLAWLAAQVGA